MMNADKHRPVWVRGLTASELDRRSEQARVMNHGQQILLESKLGKLDQRERQSVRAITRSTEDMLTSLRNMKVTTPPFSAERPASHRPNNYFTPPITKRAHFAAPRMHDDSTSSGESSEDGAILSTSSPAKTANLDLHLPRLNVRGSNLTKRRYSANDALAKSLERFHLYKAVLAKYPSSEAIQEQNASDLHESSIDHQTIEVAAPKDRKTSMSRSASFHSLESQNIVSIDKIPRPPLIDRRASMTSSNLKYKHNRYADDDVHHSEQFDDDQQLQSIDAVKAVNTHGKESRSSSAKSSLPVIRVTECKSGKENEHDSESDDDIENVEDISIVISFPLKSNRSLQSARRRSMAIQPATFRSLGHRRNSSPDVMGQTLSYHHHNMLQQLGNKATTAGNNRRRQSQDTDLESRVKDFLERAEAFNKSMMGLPEIDQSEGDIEK